MAKRKRKAKTAKTERRLQEAKRILSEKPYHAQEQGDQPEQYAVVQTEGKVEQAVSFAVSEGKEAIKGLLEKDQKKIPMAKRNSRLPEKPSPKKPDLEKQDPEKPNQKIPINQHEQVPEEHEPLPRPVPRFQTQFKSESDNIPGHKKAQENPPLRLQSDIQVNVRENTQDKLQTERSMLAPQIQKDDLNTAKLNEVPLSDYAPLAQSFQSPTTNRDENLFPQDQPFPYEHEQRRTVSYEPEQSISYYRHKEYPARPKDKPHKGTSETHSDKLNLRKKDPSHTRELQTGKEASIQTEKSSPIANGLQNRTPPLSTASQAGESAVKTLETMQNQVQILENVGEGAMGAASGGTTTAIKAGKKVVEKIGEMLSDLSQQGLSKAKGVIGPVAALLFIPIFVILMAVSSTSTQAAQSINLSDNVIALMPKIQDACERHGIPEYVNLVAAVMMQESGGNVELVNGDVMQCAEGMGYPVHTPVPVDESIDFGTSLLASYLNQAGSTGPTDLAAISLALQGYNFGSGYITWAVNNYGGYSRENAKLFSEQQAASHGWSGYGDTEYVPHVLRYYQVVGSSGDASAIAGGAFVYPMPGVKWTTYPGHEGIDIPVSTGTPVYATAAGTVTYTQGAWVPSMGYSGLASYGNCVFIDHGSGWESRYAHLSAVTVVNGTYVQQGQLIGYSGSTGNSSGSHLHLALYFNGSPRSNGVIYAEQAWPQNKQ